MNYLHYEFNLDSNDVVEVSLNKQANVRLLDSSNYQKYRRGQKYTFHGGKATKSPAHIRPPHSGNWHIVMDVGGYAGTVKASVNIKKGYVVCGRRHHNIIGIVDIFGKNTTRRNVQGFVTSDDRFVNRKDALSIALEAGQTTTDQIEFEILFSEDIY